ncbi:MAG: hypothetical protein ACRC7N_19115 [Clostridium sp.]
MLVDELIAMTTEEIVMDLEDKYIEECVEVFGSLRNLAIEYRRAAIESGEKYFMPLHEWIEEVRNDYNF